MGFSDANADADGRDLTRRYLTYLAHHPATAAALARKLAVKFVSDDPPQALVDHLAQVYLDHDTAIVPVLRALVGSTEFASAAGAQGARPGRGPGGDLPRARRRRRRARAGEKDAANADAVAGRQHRGDAVRVAAARRAADRQRVVVVAVAAARPR